jgi:hydroxymethylpyrimidine pyrophosphatase-like HAD family hydrolase
MVADQIAPDLPMVLNNGGLLIENGAIIRRRLLPQALAREAIAVGTACAADPVVHSGRQGEGRLLVQAGAPGHTLRAYYIDSSHPAITAFDGLEAAIVEDPVQVMFGGPIEAMDALLPRLEAALGAAVNIERTIYPALGMSLIDVMAAGVAKGEAVRFFEARWGLDASSTLAIGDNWNDRSMLEGAGLGFLMGNADPAMHRLGLPVLPTNEDDGVAVAIEEHVLK